MSKGIIKTIDLEGEVKQAHDLFTPLSHWLLTVQETHEYIEFVWEIPINIKSTMDFGDFKATTKAIGFPRAELTVDINRRESPMYFGMFIRPEPLPPHSCTYTLKLYKQCKSKSQCGELNS
jgi:hypothetical protein